MLSDSKLSHISDRGTTRMRFGSQSPDAWTWKRPTLRQIRSNWRRRERVLLDHRRSRTHVWRCLLKQTIPYEIRCSRVRSRHSFLFADLWMSYKMKFLDRSEYRDHLLSTTLPGAFTMLRRTCSLLLSYVVDRCRIRFQITRFLQTPCHSHKAISASTHLLHDFLYLLFISIK